MVVVNIKKSITQDDTILVQWQDKIFFKSAVQKYTISVEYIVSAQLSWVGHIYQRHTTG